MVCIELTCTVIRLNHGNDTTSGLTLIYIVFEPVHFHQHLLKFGKTT